MTIILSRLLLFLLPFIIYGLMVYLGRKGLLSWNGSWREAPHLFLTSAGLVLVLSSFLWLSLGSEEHKGETYVPARIEDGQLVPGGFRPADEESEPDATQTDDRAPEGNPQ